MGKLYYGLTKASSSMKALYIFIFCVISLSSHGYSPPNRIDSLLNILKGLEGKERLGLLDDLSWELAEIDPQKAMELAKEQLELANWLNDDAGIANAYGNVAGAHWGKGEYKEAIDGYTEGLAIRGRIGDRKGVANYMNNIAMSYQNMGNYSFALENYLQTLKTYEDIGEQGKVKGNALNNIGIVYYQMGAIKDAINYYEQALEVYQKVDYQGGIGHTFNNIGQGYYELKKYKQAEEYFKRSLEVQRQQDSQRGIGNAQINLGKIYNDNGLQEQAIIYADSAYQAYQSIGNQLGISNALLFKAGVLKAAGNLQEAILCAQKAYEVAEKIDFLNNQKDLSLLLSQLYAQQQSYQTAYTHQLKYQQLKDSLVSEDVAKELSNLRNNYELEKRNLQIEALEKEKQLKLYLIYGFIGLVVLLVIVLLSLYARYQLKKRANNALSIKNAEITHQKEEIETQRDHIEEQRDEIEAQAIHLKEVNNNLEHAYQHISSSINYATRIQAAILGQKRRIISKFVDAFILFLPKDRVSGDFYWFYEFPATDAVHEGKSIVVCADCTGHGVPGAMMTVIGNTLLNEIVKVNGYTDPDKILHELDIKIQHTLNQEADSMQQDGMDITLLCIDKKKKQASFAGAKNPLLLIRNGKMERIKGSRSSIGGNFASFEKSFDAITIELKDNDRIYLYSDGYQDQFGGENNSKFLSKRFREFIHEISILPMQTQEEKLAMTFNEWRGEGEQTDDVLVMGMRF